MSTNVHVHGRRALVGAAIAIGAIVVSPLVSHSQPPLEGPGLALDILERLEYTRAGAEAVTASMSLVEFEKQYCLPPDPPSKAREEQFLKSRDQTVTEYRNRYNRLRAELLSLIKRDGGARRAVEGKFAENPESAQAWDPWIQAFKRASAAIAAKRAELKPIPEVRCSFPDQQQPPPNPPPAGPGIELPQPRVRPVAYPKFDTPFCSESDKQAVIQRFRAVAWDYYMNYQDAREYHDAIAEALRQGRGNATVLRGLLPGARASHDTHAKALDDFNKELDRVRAMPVVDCRQQPQTAPEPIPPLLFDPFVFPVVPTVFCTQDAKDETVRQLDAAYRAAQRNYDKAAARITELGDRIAKGDRSAATSAAFNEASAQHSQWFQQSQTLNADLQRATAMPVVACAPEAQSNDRVSYGTGGIKAGFTYNFASFSKFQGMVGDQEGIATATSDETINQVGIYTELNRGNWFYGAGLRFGQHKFGQTFQPGNGRPSAGTGTVNGYFGDLYGGRRLTLGSNYSLGVYTGPTLTFNNGRMQWTYGSDVVEDVRTHTSIKWGLGAHIDWQPRGSVYGRFGAGHVSANSDADDHTYFYGGAGYTFGAGTSRFYRPGKAAQTRYQAAIRARSDSLRAAARRVQP